MGNFHYTRGVSGLIFIIKLTEHLIVWGGKDMGNNTRPNPDDRRDNVEKIEYNIGKTIQNMKRAEEMIEITDDEQMKEDLIEKNERRREALKGMRQEIREEAIARENNYR